MYFLEEVFDGLAPLMQKMLDVKVMVVSFMSGFDLSAKLSE